MWKKKTVCRESADSGIPEIPWGWRKRIPEILLLTSEKLAPSASAALECKVHTTAGSWTCCPPRDTVFIRKHQALWQAARATPLGHGSLAEWTKWACRLEENSLVRLWVTLKIWAFKEKFRYARTCVCHLETVGFSTHTLMVRSAVILMNVIFLITQWTHTFQMTNAWYKIMNG